MFPTQHPAFPQACTDNIALPSPPGPESGRGRGVGVRQGRLSSLSWGRAGGSRRGPGRSWGRTARPARPSGPWGRERSLPFLLPLLLAQPEARGLGRGPARAALHGAEGGRGSQSPSCSPEGLKRGWRAAEGTHLILDPMVSGGPHRPGAERDTGGGRRAALCPPLAPHSIPARAAAPRPSHGAGAAGSCSAAGPGAGGVSLSGEAVRERTGLCSWCRATGKQATGRNGCAASSTRTRGRTSSLCE